MFPGFGTRAWRDTLSELLTPSSLLIAGAVGTYVLGFLFRDQINIRLLVVTGSVFYALYYWTAGPEPLWDAIIGSTLIGLASLQGVIRLGWSRVDFAVPRSMRHIREAMGNIEPGLFKTLMKNGERVEAQTTTILTREGVAPESLWFVVNGDLMLEREGQERVAIDTPGFIGEIAWMLESEASATVLAQPGTEMVRWNSKALWALLKKNHRLELVIEALIAQDLARKLARSVPIEGYVAEATLQTPQPQRPAGARPTQPNPQPGVDPSRDFLSDRRPV